MFINSHCLAAVGSIEAERKGHHHESHEGKNYELSGKTESVEFVADKKGSFYAYCSVYCGPGHSHMQVSLIVE